MSGGLREYWELPAINPPVGGNGEFGQDFRAGLTKVNQDMQVVAVHGTPGEHHSLDSNRQTLIEAYQTSFSLGDSAKNEQVLAATTKVQQKTSSRATAIAADQKKWTDRQASFDAALVKIGQLEDAGHAMAPAFRKVGDAIQARVDSHDYGQASTAFDQLEPKLDAVVPQTTVQAGTGNGKAPGGGGTSDNKSTQESVLPTTTMFAAPDSRKTSERDPSERRTAVFEVRWAEDADRFYARVLAALKHDSAFRDIPSDQFNAVSSSEPQSLTGLVAAFHQSYAMRHSDRKDGQKLKVQFSANYSKDPQMWSSTLTGKTMSLVNEVAAVKPTGGQPATSAAGAAGMLARLAAEADRKGWAGMNFTVKNDGQTTVVTSMEKVGPETARPNGAAELTEAAAAKELENFMATVAEHKGNWQGHFSRDPKSGAMLFMKWSKGPDGPKAPPPPARGRQLSQAEQFEMETGMVYPQRINKTLHDVGAKALKEANPFSLQNLPYTIAGVVIPIGAMKLLTMDTAQMGIVIRIEWQLDRSIIQEATAARAAANAPKAPVPTRNLAPGDTIIVPKYGQQRVVSVTNERIITEPIKPPAPAPKNADIKPIKDHTAKDVLTKNPAKTHVFEGDSTGGYHSTVMKNPRVSVKQLEVIQNPKKHGTYKIKVEIQDKYGKIKKDSTMFPDDWTEQMVMDEVYSVILQHKTKPLPPPNAKGLIVLEGKSPKGPKIIVWLSNRGDSQVLITFFPKSVQ
jgi:hypothetical protein